jgi:hypothetical protein
VVNALAYFCPTVRGEEKKYNTDTWCQCYKTLFLLPLETLSSQVLEFDGKARANPIGGPFRFFLLMSNVRLDWKVIARYKHFSLFGLVVSNKEKCL